MASVRRHEDGHSNCQSRRFQIQSTCLMPRRNSVHHPTFALDGSSTSLTALTPSMPTLVARCWTMSWLIQLSMSFFDRPSMTSTLATSKSGLCMSTAESVNAPKSSLIHSLAACSTIWERTHATSENRCPMNVNTYDRRFGHLETSWRIQSFLETILTAANANGTIISCFPIGFSTWHGTTLTSLSGPIPESSG